MPEGPEIRLAADRVAAAVVGKPVVRVQFGLPRLKRFERRLLQARIEAIDTRGKAMLTRFDNGLTLYTHNQLYGRWYVTDGRLPDTNRSLRVALHVCDGAAFLYSASEIEVLTKLQLDCHPFLARLGPDILTATPAVIEQRLMSRDFRRRKLGGLYLNQQFLAGVGNYLRSEILHFARVHHDAAPERLEPAVRRHLAHVSYKVAQRSYRTRGVTNPATLVKKLKRDGVSYQRHRFAVFGRDEDDCHRCGTEIQRVIVGGRRLYYCPACQSG